ncbi:hypothetical protein J7J47_21330 [Halomonas sp. ISL-60]|uniref:hypothetical protein n=1 Tax=Halomonas sp. ISL-56 TaxID=2819149 RepID=UPI001BE55B6F|nr:hypothetical protein [Halomonas sp. ISL-56]MBT2774773.1 hypothetical protein [Halomonas sp. ISL-60]MBT2800905.1 hypothetical protein [Halomonas sp. ISL-56]
MKKLIATLCVVSIGALLVYFFINEEDSQARIDHIVLAAYSPEDNKTKDRNVALTQNVRERFNFDKNEDVIWQRSFISRNGRRYAIQTQTVSRDKDGRPTEILTVDDRTEEQTGRYVFNYHGSSKDIVIEHYDAHDRLSATETEQYDSRGNLIFREIRQADSGQTKKTSIEYGADDLPEKETHYKPDGSIDWVWMFKYDESKNVIEERMEVYSTENDREIYISVSEYDEFNNVVSETRLNEDEEILEKIFFEYVYDEHGNWITKKRHSVAEYSINENLIPGNLEYVWERRIEYSGSLAAEMHEAGCIFLDDTLKICPDGKLESLRQYTYSHIRTRVTMPVEDNDFMRERAYGVGIEIVSDEPCYFGCLERQTSSFIESYLADVPSFSLYDSEEISLGNHGGSLILFGNDESKTNLRAAVEAVFLTQINGRFVSFNALYIFNTHEVREEEVVGELKRAIELNLESVTEI